MLSCIQQLHEIGYCHNDIKPDNFLLDERGKLYITDFGFTEQLYENGAHILIKKQKQVKGTLRYVSLNVHKGLTASRRDDLYSWFYVVVSLTTHTHTM